jgi:ADP-ribosylglycohydrolase
MVIKILAFGMLNGILPEEITFQNEGIDLELVKAYLMKNHPSITQFSYSVAVNHAIVNQNVELKNGDVIALMPPFSGQHNHAWSDGLAMRVAPIGVLANGDIAAAKRMAIADGDVSHSGEGIHSGIAIAVAVTSGMAGKGYLEVYSDALNSVPKDSWTYRTLVDAQNILNENVNETLFVNAEKLLEKVAQTKYFFADLAPEAVSLALASVLYGKGDFAKSLLFAVNLGRDADTIAAMAGAVAGSISGYENIPDKWKVAVTSVGGSCLAFTKGMEPLGVADSLVEMGNK